MASILPVNVSLDNITLVGNIRCKRSFPAFVNDARRTYIEEYKSNPTGYPYVHTWKMMDGTHLSVSAPESKLPEMRMEFNPNKWMEDEAKEILAWMKHARPTRIDTAMDYDHDLSNYVLVDSRARKRNIILSGAGKLQTVYLGARSSEDMVRIYDKAEEQGEKSQTLWRVELQRRFRPDSREYFPRSLFHDIYMVMTQSENFVDKAVLAYLRDHPEGWGEMTPYQRRTYKSKLATSATVRIDFASGYVHSKGALVERYEQIISFTETYKTPTTKPVQYLPTPF